uniref:Fanconi anemia group I protein-like n=4 Tax=Hirondellea gigas TaxID=1518452 RepID=A0A6A7G4B5_9CRUS
MAPSNKLLDKIKELIKNNELKVLEEVAISKGESKIIEVLSKLLRIPEGATVADGLLSALQGNTRESLTCRVKIFECLFEFVHVESGGGGGVGGVTELVLGALVGVLLRQLDRFPTHALLPFVEQYLELVKIGEPLQGRWVDLLPKLLCTLSERNDVYEGARQMSGEAYRYQVLKNLCDYDWPAETTTTLLLVVKEMNLEKQELSDIVHKVERVLRDVEYQSVPPIIYQLVLVAQTVLPGAALKICISYFNTQESKLSVKEKERDEAKNRVTGTSPNMDDISSAEQDEHDIELERQRRDLHEAQSTVILHLTHLSQFDPNVAKDYIKLLKSSTWLPHVLFSPFNLPLSLSLASIERYQEQVLDAVQKCVLHCLLQQHRSRESAWLRKTWQQHTDLQSVLRSTINNCAAHCDQVSGGLCLLLLNLLEGGIGVRNEAASLAVATLPLLVSRHPRLAQHCIKHIANCTITANNTQHYVEVLGRISLRCPLLLLEHHSLVRELLVEQLQHHSLATATHVLNALYNSLKIDVPLRDALIITLRKMLFSRNVDSRVVAVRGFLLLLRQLRVVGALPSSQASLSFSSALSQISCTAQVHSEVSTNRNQTLCFELLGVLRRCFSQQHQVRSALYAGLYDVCRVNPKLCPNILSLLHQHLTGFIDLRPDTLNPVVLKKTVQVHGDTATLQEPLGNLLGCLSACKVYYERKRAESSDASRALDDDEEEDEENAVAVLNDICVVFDVLAEKLSTCDLDDLEFDNRMEFSTTAEGQKNIFYAQIMVAVYDAVIDHSFYTSGVEQEDKMNKCVSLFKIQRKIVELVKSKSIKLPSKKGDGSKGKSKPASKQSVTFNCTLRLTVLADLLSTAFGEEDGVSESSCKILKDNYDLQIYILTAIESIVNDHKNLIPSEKDRQIPYFRKIGRVLFVECYEHMAKMESGDEREVSRIRLCINIFNSLFGCFTKFHKDKLEQIMKELTNKTANKDIDALSFILFKGCQKMLIRILHHNEKDPLMKDAATLLEIMSQIAKVLSYDCEQIERAHEWVVLLAKEQSNSHTQFCEKLLKLAFILSDQIRTNHNYYHEIAQDIYHCLGDNNQNVSVAENSVVHSIISEDVISNAVTVLIAHVDDTLSLVDMSLSKQRAFLLTSTDHNANKVEEYINVKLGIIIKTMNEIVRSALPLGPVMDLVIKKADKLYSILAIFVRYYLDLFRLKNYPQISEKFEKLVHMSGELLSDPLYVLLNYIEDTRSNGKTLALHTALKESRMIPSLVFAIERYEKLVIQLSKKSKVNLMTSMKLSTLRDFKIEQAKMAQNLDETESEGDPAAGEEEPATGEGRDKKAKASRKRKKPSGEVPDNSAPQKKKKTKSK